PPDGQLEPARRGLWVPPGDGLRNQVADLGAVLLHDRRREVDDEVVELREQVGVGEERRAEFADAPLERAGRRAVGAGRIGGPGAPYAPPYVGREPCACRA